MERYSPTWTEIDLVGKIADLKDDQYRITLAVSTLMELLVDKGVITKDDISNKASELDTFIHLTQEFSSSQQPYPTE